MSAESEYKSASHRLRQYEKKHSPKAEPDEDEIVPYLAVRAYHLPGNDYWEDWVQYNINNHPVMGICCHHELHPVGKGMRVVALVGSIMFGLAISCIIWLGLVYHNHDPESVVTEIKYGDESIYVVTTGDIVLWTVGSGLHSLFDNFIWYSISCPCFQPGSYCGHEAFSGCRAFGGFLVVIGVVLLTAISTLSVLLRLLRASNEDLDIEDFSTVSGVGHQAIQLRALQLDSYDFLFSYLIEVFFAYYYYPVFSSIFFSGVLGCGRFPIVGGRPYAILKEQEKLRQDIDQKETEDSFELA